MTSKIVSILGVIAVAVLVGFDILLAVDKIDGNTWSEIIRAHSKRLIILPWACGILCGHWFHPAWSYAVFGQPASVALMIWLSVFVLLVGLSYSLPMWLFCLLGMLAGSWLWPCIL